MRRNNGTRTVNAVETSFDILEYIQREEGAGVTALADDLSRSKGSIHAHLATLLDREYVVKDGDEYRLSLRYVDLAESVKDRFGIYEVVTDELDELVDENKELAQFAVEEHGRAVYLYKTHGAKAVQTASRVGTREHLHCIALGKAILAHLTEERVEHVVDRHGLPGFTDNTITDYETLTEELERVRERGFAFDNEEKIQGLRCVAAPVRGRDGDVLGAVSVSGPSSRMGGERFREEIPEQVMRSANVIEINAKFS